MFNEHFGLESATLDGSKTRTSRKEFVTNANFSDFSIIPKEDSDLKYGVATFDDHNSYRSRYGINEILAIKQSYKDAGFQPDDLISCPCSDLHERARNQKGWNNKMFVCPSLMPHQIQITNIKLEKIQRISNDDCIREGIVKSFIGFYCVGLSCKDIINEAHVETANSQAWKLYPNPHTPFKILFDKVGKKGLWESNPWVFAYYYKLIK